MLAFNPKITQFSKLTTQEDYKRLPKKPAGDLARWLGGTALKWEL